MNMGKNDEYKFDLMVRVAWAYYVGKMTQEKIAECYNLQRIKVQRLLKEATDCGLVTVSIQAPHCNMLSDEKKLAEKYGLLEAVVTPCVTQDAYHELAIATALYLERRWLSTIKILGIGEGKTMSNIPCGLEVIPRENHINPPAVVSLKGVLTAEASMSSLDNALRIAQVLGSELYGIWSPAFTRTEEEQQLFLRQESIRKSLELANHADIKLLSVGTLNGCGLLNNRLVDPEVGWRLKKAGAVGEIMSHFFDMDGNIIDHDVTRRSVVIDFPSKHGKVVCVAAGIEKVDVIRAAMKGKLIDVLVTDSNTCRALLD